MSFIVDLMNNLLTYNEINVFIVIDMNKDIWFSLKDILMILGYSNPQKTIGKIDINNDYKRYFYELSIPNNAIKPYNFQPKTMFICESGLYNLFSLSKKPKAKSFQKELFEVILPSIRRTGEYKIDSKSIDRLKELNDRINELEEIVENLKDEVEFFETKKKSKGLYKSTIYIRKYELGRKSCFKIGFTNNIMERKSKKKTETADRNLYELDIDVDGKQTEECVRNLYKLHLIKKKADILCYISLDQLIQSFTDCISFITSHNGKCGHCQKEMNLAGFGSHYKTIADNELVKEKHFVKYRNSS